MPHPTEVLASVVDLLASVDRPGDWCASGTRETPTPRIDVDGVGPLSFPIPPAQARELVALAEPAPYGRGGETLLDPAVRRVWQLRADRVHPGSRWDGLVDAILHEAAGGLGVDGSVRAELYKLLVYEPGCFFVEHRDSEKTDGMFATLVVVLPSEYAGGELIVRHGERSVTLDLRTPEPGEIAWAAFYADCLHELRPVTAGHRVCLVYNLAREGGSLPAPDHEAAVAELARVLDSWTREPAAWPTKVALALEHHYTPAGLSFAALKNADRGVASVVVEAARRAACVVHLAMVAITETGSAEDNHDYGGRRWRRPYDDHHFEVIEVFDRVVAAEGWRSPDDRNPDLPRIPMDDDEIWPPNALDEEVADEQHYQEATGNEGAEFQRIYRRAALVLWPAAGQLAVLAQAGPAAAVPLLEPIVEHPRDHDVARTFARLVLDRWGPAVPERGSWRWSERYVDPEDSRQRMLGCLARLDAGDEIERFLDTVIVPTFGRDRWRSRSGAGDAALVAALGRLDPHRAGLVVARGVRPAACHAPERCVALVEELASAGLVAVAIAAADAVVDGLTAPSERRWAPSVDPVLVGSLLRAAWRLGSPQAAVRVAEWAATQSLDRVLLPAALALADEGKHQPGWDVVAGACVTQLSRRAAEPLVEPKGLARPATWACGCPDCRSFRTFLASPTEATWTLKGIESHRRHVEAMIREHRLDVERATRRTSPRTLVCTKNSANYERRVALRASDLAALERLGAPPDLTGGRSPPPPCGA